MMIDPILVTKLAALSAPRGGDEPSLKQWIRDCEQIAGRSLFARDTTGTPILLAGWLGMSVAPLMARDRERPFIIELVGQNETVWWNELEDVLHDEELAAALHPEPCWAAAWALVANGSLPMEQAGDFALVGAALRRGPQEALRVWNWMARAPDLDNADLSWVVIVHTELPCEIPTNATWKWWRLYARLTALMTEGSGVWTVERLPLCPDRLVRGIVDAVQQGQIAPTLAADQPKPHEQLQLGVMAYLSAGRGHDLQDALAAWDAWKAQVGGRWTDEAVRLVGTTEQLLRLRYDRSGQTTVLASIAERLFDNADATREWLLGYRGWKRFKMWRQMRQAYEDTQETIQLGMLLADDFPGWPMSHIDLNMEHERSLPFLVDVKNPTHRLDPALADPLWARRPGSSHRPMPAWIWVMCWALGRRGALPVEWLALDDELLWSRLRASPQFNAVLGQLPDSQALLKEPAPRSAAILGLPAQTDRHGLQVQRLSPTDPLALVLGIFSDCCQHIFNELLYPVQVANSPNGAYLVVRDGDAIIAQGIFYAVPLSVEQTNGWALWLDTLETPKDVRRSARSMRNVESAVWAYLGRACAALELRGMAPCTPFAGRLYESPSPLPSWTVPFISPSNPEYVREMIEQLAFPRGVILESTTGYADPGGTIFVPDARCWLLSGTAEAMALSTEDIVAAMKASTPSYWRGFTHQLAAFPHASAAIALAVGAAWATRFGFPCSWEMAMELARVADQSEFRAIIQHVGQVAEEGGESLWEATHPWRDMLDTLVLAAQATVPATLEKWQDAWLLTVPSEPYPSVLWAWPSRVVLPDGLEWYVPLTDGPLLYKIATARAD